MITYRGLLIKPVILECHCDYVIVLSSGTRIQQTFDDKSSVNKIAKQVEETPWVFADIKHIEMLPKYLHMLIDYEKSLETIG